MKELLLSLKNIFISKSYCILFLSLLLIVVHTHAQIKLPNTAEGFFEIGEDLLSQEKWMESINAFNDCLRINPHFADAYYSRGMAREQLKKFSDALTDYSIHLELKPDHSEALLNRAQLRYQLNLYELAKEDFEQLLRMPRNETSTVYFRQQPFGGGVDHIFTTQGSGKAYLFNWLGLTETQLHHYPSAIIHFDSALRLSPRDADFFVNRGIAHQQNKDLTKARQDFEKALSFNPYHATAKYNLSVLQTGKGNNSALLDSALSDNAKLPYAYAEKAYRYMYDENYAKALQCYNEAIRLDASEPTYYLNRGLVHEKLQQYTAAYRDYSAALNLDERFEKAWLNRGNVLMKQQKFQEAVDDYTSALVYQPDYASAYYNRSLAYRKLNQLTEACRDLLQAEALGMKIPSSLRSQICKK